MTLSPAIQRWIADAVGPGAAITAIRPLAGATSAALYAVDVTRAGRSHALVLRLYTNAAWLDEEPDLPQHEAAALRMAGDAGIAVPELVAVEDSGAVGGVPALLMTRLPGRVVLDPPEMDAWLVGLAQAAARIHTVSAPDFAWQFEPYSDVPALAVPPWTSQPDVWRRVVDVVQGPPPETLVRFIHRDYHPVNVLWAGDVPGVVDWANACLGPVGEDVGRCRANLALLHGVVTADAFLRAFEAVAGSAFDYHPYWDLLTVADMFLPGPPGVYSGWPDHGVRGLTDVLMHDRLETYVGRVVAQL